MEIENINVDSSGGHPESRSHSDGTTPDPQKDLNLGENHDQNSIEQEGKNDEWKTAEGASGLNNCVTNTCGDQTRTDIESHQNDSSLRSDGSLRSTPVSVLETMSTEVEDVDRLLPRPPGQFANGPLTVSRSAPSKQSGSEDDEGVQDALSLETSSIQAEDGISLPRSHTPGQFVDSPVSRNTPLKQTVSEDPIGVEDVSQTESEGQRSSTGSPNEENTNCREHMNSQSEQCAIDNVDQRLGIVVDKPLPNSPGQFVDGLIIKSAEPVCSEDPKGVEDASPSKGEEEQCSSTASPVEVNTNCRESMNSQSENCASDNVDPKVWIFVDKPLPNFPGQFVDGPISKSVHGELGDSPSDSEGQCSSTSSAKEGNGNCRGHIDSRTEQNAINNVDQRVGIVVDKPLTSSPGQFVDEQEISRSASAEETGSKADIGTEGASPSYGEVLCSSTGSEQCTSDNGDQRIGSVADSDGDSFTHLGQASPLRQNPGPENTTVLTLKLESKEETIHNSHSGHPSDNTLSQTETLKSADVDSGSKTTSSAVRATVELDLGGSKCTVVECSSNSSQMVKEVSRRGSDEAGYRLGGGSPKEMPGSDNLPGSNVDVCNIEDAASDHSPGASFDHWQDNMDMQDGSNMNERRLEEGECYDDESCTFIKCRGCNELVISGELIQHVIQCTAQPGLDEDHTTNQGEEDPSPPPQEEETMEVECPKCGVGFSKNEDLTIHIQIHEMLAKNAREAQETTRMKQLMTQAKEQMVMQDPEQQGRSSQCKVCLQRFADPTMAPYHEMMHDKFAFHCRKCDMFFSTLVDLQRQLCGNKNKKRHRAFRYKCGTCKGGLLDGHKMMKHTRKCKGKVEVCMLCRAKFNSFEDLKCHIEVCAVRKTKEIKPGDISDIDGLAGAYENGDMENHSDDENQDGSSLDDMHMSQEESISEKCAVRHSPSSTTEGPPPRSADQVRNQPSGDIVIEHKDKNTLQKASSLDTVQNECNAALCQLCGVEMLKTQPRFERSCKKPSKFCNECINMNHRQLKIIIKKSDSKLGTDTNHVHPLTEQLPMHREASDDKSHEDSVQKTERKKKEKSRKRKLGEICGACGKEFPDFESLADHAAGCNHVKLGKSCETEPLAQETTEHGRELKVDWQCPQSERAKKKHCPKCNRTFWKNKMFQKHLKLCIKKSDSKLGTNINHGHPPTEQLPVRLEASDDKNHEGSIQKTEREKKEKKRKRKLGEICGACGKEFPDFESLADHSAGCNHVKLGKSCETEPLAQETTKHGRELKVDWQCPQSERAKKKRCPMCNRKFWKNKKFQKHVKLCKVKQNSPLDPKNAVKVTSSEDDLPLTSLQKRSKIVHDVNERENDASPLKNGGDPIERIRIECTKTSLRSKDYHTYHSCKVTGDEERTVETVDSLINCKNDIANEKSNACHMQEKQENAAFTVESSSVSNAFMTSSTADEDLSVRTGTEGKYTDTGSRHDEGTDSPAGDDQQDVPSVPCNEKICPPSTAENYEDTQAVEEGVEATKQVPSMKPMSVGISVDQATDINPNNVSVMPKEHAAETVIPASVQSIGRTTVRHGSSSSVTDVLTSTNENSAPQEIGLPDGPDKVSSNSKVSVASSQFSQCQKSDCLASSSKEIEMEMQAQVCLNGGMIAFPQEEISGAKEHKYLVDNQEGDGLSGNSSSKEDLCKDFAESLVSVSGSPGNLVDGQSLDVDAGSNGCFMPLVDENAALGHHCVYCAGEFRSREDLWEHAKGCRDNHLMVIAKAVNGVQEMQLVSPDDRSCVPFTVLPDIGVASRRLREEIGVNLSKVGKDGIGADAIVKPEAKKAKRNRNRSRSMRFRNKYRYSKFGLIELSDPKKWKLENGEKRTMGGRSPQRVDLSNVFPERVRADVRTKSAKKKKKKNKKEKEK